MADAETPGSGDGNKKRNTKAGVLSEKSQKQRDNAIRIILENWKITHLDQVFPASIKPISLGNSSISHIKLISDNKSLTEARSLFLNACKNDAGEPVPMGFGHTDKVWRALRDAGPEENDDDMQENLPKSKRQSTSRRSTNNSQSGLYSGNKANRVSTAKPQSELKNGNNPKVPTSPFSIGGSRALLALRKNNENAKPKSVAHTKGAATPKEQISSQKAKKIADPHKEAFGFLSEASSDDDSPLANKTNKKRPGRDIEEQPAPKKVKSVPTMLAHSKEVAAAKDGNVPALPVLFQEVAATKERSVPTLLVLSQEVAATTKGTVPVLPVLSEAAENGNVPTLAALTEKVSNQHSGSDDEDDGIAKMQAAHAKLKQQSSTFFNLLETTENEEVNPMRGLFTPSSSPAPRGSPALDAPAGSPTSPIPRAGDSDTMMVDCRVRGPASVQAKKTNTSAGSGQSSRARPDPKDVKDTKERKHGKLSKREDMKVTPRKGAAEQPPKFNGRPKGPDLPPKNISPGPGQTAPTAPMYSAFSSKMDDASLQDGDPLSHIPGPLKLTAKNITLPGPKGPTIKKTGVAAAIKNSLPDPFTTPANLPAKKRDSHSPMSAAAAIKHSFPDSTGAPSNVPTKTDANIPPRPVSMSAVNAVIQNSIPRASTAPAALNPYSAPVRLANILGPMKELMDKTVERARQNGQNSLAEGLGTVFGMTLAGVKLEFEKQKKGRD